jgi:hypothetical protein
MSMLCFSVVVFNGIGAFGGGSSTNRILVYTERRSFTRWISQKDGSDDLFGLEFLGTWNWINQYSLADMDGMAFSTGVHNIPFYF